MIKFCFYLIFLLAVYFDINTAPGDLDQQFNPAGLLPGTVISNIGSNGYIASLALKAGKIVVGGTADFSSISRFLVAQYNHDGSLDTAFGSPNGYVTTSIMGSADFINAIALQSNGKIVAGGIASNSGVFIYEFALARYNNDGSLDTSFGSPNGYVTNAINGQGSIIKTIAIQADGKIVVGGFADAAGTGVYNCVLARYNIDGTLDTTFGAPHGYVVAPSFSFGGGITSLAIEPNGKIVAAGYGVTSDGAAMVVRYHTDGSLDTTFGAPNGYVTTVISGGIFGIMQIVLQSDGKILAGGYLQLFDGSYKFVLARYNTDGSPDNTFGSSNGYVVTSIFGYYDVINSIALQANGKILAGGVSQLSESGTGAFVLARYTTSGNLDHTFGAPNGYVITNFLPSGDSVLNSLKISADFQTIVGGGQVNNTLGLARYLDTEIFEGFTARLIDKYAGR